MMRGLSWKGLIVIAAMVASIGFGQSPPLPQPSAGLVPLPPPRSPVETFRELLAMPRAERAKIIHTRPPETQKLLLAKLREYESLKPEQRELRLKSTELRWYLLPLMHSPSTNRSVQLQHVPEEDRALLAARLKEWDALPPQVQQELLANEATIQYFTEINSGTATNISGARRQKLEAGVAQWRALPEARRQELVSRFNQFFDLKPEEKARALSNVTPAERRQIERTLKAFERLPEVQREQCIRSFDKFASMSLAERQEFFKNAERWKLMSPEERQSWRELVSRLSSQPPLPDAATARRIMPPNPGTPPLPPMVSKTNS